MLTEILLFTHTSFANRELCERDDAACNESKGSTAEELEKACWSGMLPEILPDVFERNIQNLFIWQISQADQFIRLVMGEAPGTMEYEKSIDPRLFAGLPDYIN